MSDATIPSLVDGRLDVRETPCKIKHSLIMETWRNLLPGSSFVLINGHDPLPLYYEIIARYPGELDWQYEQRGPEVFAIKLRKLDDGELAHGEAPDAPVNQRSCEFFGENKPVNKGIDVDARGLEPPQPMMKILEAAAPLKSGQEIRTLTDRRPIHLEPMLQAKGLTIRSEERPDSSWLNVIRRP